MDYTCQVEIQTDIPMTLLRMGALTLSWTPHHLECRVGEHVATLPSKRQFTLRVVSGPTVVCFVDDARADVGVALTDVLPMHVGPDQGRVRINGFLYDIRTETDH